VYIHLMKHWSEKFDEFKQIQSEVKLQRWFELICVYPLNETLVWRVWRVQTSSEWSRLNKKINFLRCWSRRQWFELWVWHIIRRLVKRVSQITSHRTPQCYGVFARCDHNPLDNVWSIISLIELLLSFELYVRIKTFTLDNRETI